ncbi:MAG: endonuclease/exonuclease/phosphatase family protein [Bacteroidales bacterium]
MLFPHLLKSQSEIIAFHNCENFFYPTNDSLTNDDDFTGSSPRNWNWERFNLKKDLLAKTYIALSKGNLPAIIGLCEIENQQVLNALCNDSPLKKGDYDFIHYNSPDIRGMDVAMIYRKDKFKVITHEKIVIDSSLIIDEPTRDILYVNGLLNKIPLHIFVVHAPSRRNNDRNKPLRKSVFELIYKKSKELYDKGEKNIIIMGDFNDNPWDNSVEEGFRTSGGYHNHQPILTNLMKKDKNKRGSYTYSGQMLNFDQFIVTKEMEERIDTLSNPSHIFIPDFMIDPNPKTTKTTPFSTYKGYKYQGGISDHFPIFMKVLTPKQ